MDNHQKTDYISWTILIGILLLFVEITFFNKGLIFSMLFSGALIYFGSKRIYSSVGKVIFLLGCLILFFTTINMMVFKFLIFAIIAYILYYFYQSKNRPHLIEPRIKEENVEDSCIKITRPQVLFKNILFGRQRTSEDIYEWHDINIHVGLGDSRIDLSNTVLPKGESVILIRNFIGNIQILVPYDIEVSVSHSVIAGTTNIFDSTSEKMYNQTVAYRTENYDESLQKIKIITSMGMGRLEVKRI